VSAIFSNSNFNFWRRICYFSSFVSLEQINNMRQSHFLFHCCMDEGTLKVFRAAMRFFIPSPTPVSRNGFNAPHADMPTFVVDKWFYCMRRVDPVISRSGGQYCPSGSCYWREFQLNPPHLDDATLLPPSPPTPPPPGAGKPMAAALLAPDWSEVCI
jgi:hypothetical protein